MHCENFGPNNDNSGILFKGGSGLEIRAYHSTDCKEMSELFYDTVHAVNAGDYTMDQLDAWADGDINLDAWNQSFLQHETLIAMEDGKIVGFGDIDETGYLDRLFVHKDYQRRGIAKALCDQLEKQYPQVSVTTHASITAKPFFEKRGYRVVKEQLVQRRGVFLKNYVMQKQRYMEEKAREI
jgi:putative acetyltransferase